MSENNKSAEVKQLSFEEFISTIKFQADEDYLLREIAGESILIPVGDRNQNSGSMFSLNETCVYLWKIFQTPKTIRQAVIDSLKDYEAEEQELIQDIFSFVRDYVQLGLMKEWNEHE